MSHCLGQLLQHVDSWVDDRSMRADQETYTHGHAPSVLRSHLSRTVDDSAAYLAPHLRPGDHVLDVGCGPGTVTVDLARRVAPGRVVGIEPVEAPLGGARELAAGTGNVEFRIGDVYALDALDGSYDVVHAHQVLQHLTDPVAALREMLRVSRRLVAARDADYAAMSWYPADPRLDRWLEIYRAVARGNGAEPDAGRRMLAWARAAGATSITTTTSVWSYATPEQRGWWGGLWADRILTSAITRQAVDGGHATADELADISAAWKRWAADEDGWFGIVHGEVLLRV